MFLDGHESWVVDVGGLSLAKKGLTVTDYKRYIMSPDVPMDELALMCLARLWHRHCGSDEGFHLDNWC